MTIISISLLWTKNFRYIETNVIHASNIQDDSYLIATVSSARIAFQEEIEQ